MIFLIMTPILFLIIIGVFAFFAILIGLNERKETRQHVVWEHASAFERKTYIFDTVSEFKFFKVLIELFGDTYYIFPQVNLSHLIEPKDKGFYEYRRNRSRIEKKSVDFVICDKQRVVPQLVIELDGSSHRRADRVKRDVFVNQLMKDVDLPILRITSGNFDREAIRTEIEGALEANSPK